jgi:hypothetical protein
MRWAESGSMSTMPPLRMRGELGKVVINHSSRNIAGVSRSLIACMNSSYACNI